MSGARVDVVVQGGGVNGLVAATWLARRGMSVRLFERADTLGGLAASHEFHPGYHTNGTLVETQHFPQALASELGLSQHGLSRRLIEPTLHVSDGSGSAFSLEPELEAACAGIRAHSPADADAYRTWREQLARWQPFIEGVLRAAPPDLDASDLSGALALAGTGLKLRRLGERDMVELLRSAPLSLSDWLAESFELEALRVALAAPALEGAIFGPRGAGGTALSLAYESVREASVAGGARALVDALTKAARAAGVQCETGRELTRIELDAEGVRAALLADGERVECGALLATASPKQVLLELLPPNGLPPSLRDAARGMRARGTIAVLDLALDGPFELAQRSATPPERVITAGQLVQLERASDAPKYDQAAAQPWLAIACPSASDPGLCPAGHAVLTLFVHTAPHTPRGGWTDEARASLLASAQAVLERVAPTVRERRVAERLRTPLELERELRLPGGHLHQLEAALDQLLVGRPTATCARYETPIPGLYLGGRGGHPGGRTSGMEGRLAADSLARLKRRARSAR